MTTTFPASDIDRDQKLMAQLGSFWGDDYHAVDQVRSYIRGRQQAAWQSNQTLQEAVDAASRLTTPVFRRENWFSWTIKASDRNDARTSLLRYDEDALYDGSFRYDIPKIRKDHAFPRPTGLAAVNVISNRITAPSVLLVKGIDFAIDEVNSAVVFRNNPFTDDRIAKLPIYEDGVVVDQELTLWFFYAVFDENLIHEQYGHVIELQMPSSERYRDTVNALFDGIVEGSTRHQLELALTAVTGIPLVREETETVEIVEADWRYLLVITDAHVYRFAATATPVVAVGNIVHAGEPLVDAIEIIEFNTGAVPTSLRALTMGKGFLAAGFLGEILFENKMVPLLVDETHPSGFTYVSFDLGGFPLDVDRFFTEMHAAGVARNETLAMLLDRRTNKVGQPRASNLPATINPLEFLVENVLRNNAFVVRVKPKHADMLIPGVVALPQFRKLLPPHTAMLIVIELTPDPASVTLDDADASGVRPYSAPDPLSEPAAMIADGHRIRLRTISEVCQ